MTARVFFMLNPVRDTRSPKFSSDVIERKTRFHAMDWIAFRVRWNRRGWRSFRAHWVACLTRNNARAARFYRFNERTGWRYWN